MVKLNRLIEQIIKKCSQEQLKNVIGKVNGFSTDFFHAIKQVSVNNSRSYNRDELVAFDCSLLFTLDDRVADSVAAVSEGHNKNLKKIQNNYKVKIANFGNSNKGPSL